MLGIYKPDFLFLEQQLISLNQQDYPYCFLNILDDGDDDETFERITKLVESTMRNFPFTLLRNIVNQGSSKVFEELTKKAQADFLAYCDQDDVWKNEKISILVKLIEEEKANLAYSDLEITDSLNNVLYKSIMDVNPTLKHISGDGCFDTLVTTNFVTGCSMLIKSEVAKKSIPFCKYYVHDHWLALNASFNGTISYTNMKLVKYRQHGNNQIGGKIAQLFSKQDYLNKYLYVNRSRLNFLIDENLFPSKSNHLLRLRKNFTDRIGMFEKSNPIKALSVILFGQHNIQYKLFESSLLILSPNHLAKLVDVFTEIKRFIRKPSK